LKSVVNKVIYRPWKGQVKAPCRFAVALACPACACTLQDLLELLDDQNLDCDVAPVHLGAVAVTLCVIT
jgi:hypothetical protein